VVLDAADRAWPDLEKVAPPMPERSSPLPPPHPLAPLGGSQRQRVHLRLTPSERATLEDVVDPAEWLPDQQVSRYIAEWVAVKTR
jgi:hypothetical protein